MAKKQSLVPATVNTVVEHKVQLSVTQNDLIEMIISEKLDEHQKAIEVLFDELDATKSINLFEKMQALVKVPKAITDLCKALDFKKINISFNYDGYKSKYVSYMIADRNSWDNSCKVYSHQQSFQQISEVSFQGERNKGCNTDFHVNLPIEKFAPEVVKFQDEQMKKLGKLYADLEFHQREYRKIKKESGNAKSKLIREALTKSDEGKAIITMLDGIGSKLLPGRK